MYIYNIYLCIWYSFLGKVFRFHIESWPKWDSNPRPRTYRTHALTTELSGRTMGCDKNRVRLQGKGSRSVVLDNEDYIKKVEHQINKSSFQRLKYGPTKSFVVKVNTCVEK